MIKTIQCIIAAVIWTLSVEISISQETTLGKFLGAKEAVYPDWFKQSFLDFEEDIAEATTENKRLMLYFHQDGCPYCNKLVEDNFSDPTIAEHVKKNLDVVAINMWGDREVIQIGGKGFTEKTLAAALKVNFTPTLLFFNEQRKVALRLDGYLPPDNFLTALDYVSGKMENQLSYASYIASLGIGKDTGKLNPNPWASGGPTDLSSLDTSRPTVIFFEEPDCTNCDLLYQKTLQDKFAEPLLSQFNVFQLNRWSNTPVTLFDRTTTSAKKWAEQLDLSYSPSMVLFSPGGEEIIKVTAMFKTFHILGVFDYVASQAYITEPSFQRYLTSRAEHIRESGEDVDIWKY